MSILYLLISLIPIFLNLRCASSNQMTLHPRLKSPGIRVIAVKAWLFILEASYIIILLQPHFKNFNRRLIKAPKLYFCDPGLACFLLGIESEEQVMNHYARGHLFENMIIIELFKSYYNADRMPHLYFWRDKSGHEIDCLIEKGEQLFLVEIKAGETINTDYFKGLIFWNTLSKTELEKSFIVYGGTSNQQRSLGTVLSWTSTARIFEMFDAKTA